MKLICLGTLFTAVEILEVKHERAWGQSSGNETLRQTVGIWLINSISNFALMDENEK